MKKIVRLTESDLTRIVRRVLRETQEKEMEENFLSNLFGGNKEKITIRTPKGKEEEYDKIFLCNREPQGDPNSISSTGPKPRRSVMRKDGTEYLFVNSEYAKQLNLGSQKLKYKCPDELGWRWNGYKDMISV